MGTVTLELTRYAEGQEGRRMRKAEEKAYEEQRTFVNLKETKREPRPEETDEEILAWMTREIQADKRTLDLLAEL